MRYPEHNSCSKSQISKQIQESGRCRLKNCQMRYLSFCFTGFFLNLLPRSVLATANSIPSQCIHRGITKQNVSISFYYSPKKAKKSTSNRLNAKRVKYSNFYDIWAKVSPILMKFRTAKHIRLPKFYNFKMQVDRRRTTRKLRKVLISIYSLSQIARKCITVYMPNTEIFKRLRYLWGDVWPILMKFCMMTHISYPEHNSCSKSQIYKNSRWWTLAFKKMINAISQKLFV